MPHCGSAKAVKNGRKSTKVQNYLCQTCGKQFIAQYKNEGINTAVKIQIVSILSINYGIRDTLRLCIKNPIDARVGRV